MTGTGGDGSCSITVHLKQTQQVSGGGVLFEACRVGRVNVSDGSIVLNWDLGELTGARESVSTESVTKQLSTMLYADGSGGKLYSEDGTLTDEVQTLRAVTGPDGTCCFTGISEGAWLIHALDSTSYGQIEDTLAAVPCYVMEGEILTGPVYDPEIWPKSEIKTTNVEKEPQSETTLEKTKKETAPPQTSVDTGMTETEKRTSAPLKKTKKDTGLDHGPITAGSTQTVRTLDDAPLSVLLFAFLSCALVIGLIMVRYGRKLRQRARTICPPAAGQDMPGRKNRKKSPGSFCLLLTLGCGMLLTLSCQTGAAETSDPVAEQLEGERKILFVNEASTVPCLTVSKEVLDAENGSRAPAADRFVFRLMLDNERAGSVKYRVFNEEGVELVDLTGEGTANLVPAGSGASDPVPLRTGRDGTFSLCRGQYALFEDVSVGQIFEVTEQANEQYERLIPASSATVSGTIERNGSSAQFVNRYAPEDGPGFTEGTLEITKQILWPEDVDLPQRGPFQIRVLVDNAPWANAPVELYDLSGNTGMQRLDTDENGIFEIMGGQRACIRGLPSGSDLFVEEIDDPEDLFVPSGNISWKGASSAREKITFTNRLADFVVSKRAPLDDAGHRFLFRLQDREDQPMNGVSYYLVREDGTLDQAQPFSTDAEGHFTLGGGERAVFTGLAEGSRYSVLEEKILGYKQVIPDNPEGYRQMTVRNGVPVLAFENERTSVKMFVPSAGGSGIWNILLLSAIGMGGCCLGIGRGRWRAERKQRHAKEAGKSRRR